MTQVLLDTCVIFWMSHQPAMLSKKAADLCLKPDIELFVSSISFWEIAVKVKKGRMALGIAVEDYVVRWKKCANLTIVPVDEFIWLKNVALEWDHGDPADRTIVATALSLHLPLITKDEAIGAFYKKTIW